ncbi:oligosaccharide flippase family protein [Shouchella patagoniensis]|uniref:oligosaccharide flippase family protein n=1 Tax=Shouchella patagoniensis TaxID=228576 RepID=UPI0014753C6D|nr:oligosaccharide flippase family protein [Shouchella patagoniensis]
MREKTPLSLRRNFSVTFISNIIYAACQWGVIIIIAQLGSPEKLGMYSLALAITSPILLLTNLQLRNMQITDVNNKYQFSDFFTFRIISSCISVVIIIIVALLFDYDYMTVIVIILIGGSKFIESISDVSFGLFQKNERMDYVAVSKNLKAISSIFSFSITLWITGSLVYSVITLAISWLLILIFFDLRNVNKFSKMNIKFNLDKKKMITIFKVSLPLGIMSMLLSLNSTIPRYIIENYMNLEALGYFSALVYLYVAGNTVISALGQSAAPRLAKYYASNNLSMFKLLLKKLNYLGLFIGIISVIFVVLLGELFLKIFYGVEYAVYTKELNLIMIAACINNIAAFYGYGLTATKSFKIQPYIGFTMVVVSFLTSILLIPKLGLLGASYALIAGAIVQLTMLIVILKIKLSKTQRGK